MILPVLTLDQRPKLLPVVGNPRNGSLLGAHGDAIRITVVAIVGVKLPALVDEIIVILAIIPNEVTILVGGIINTGRAKPVIIVHSVQISQRILLRLLPILISLCVEGIVICLVL
jgi:hypothetical protein